MCGWETVDPDVWILHSPPVAVCSASLVQRYTSGVFSNKKQHIWHLSQLTALLSQTDCMLLQTSLYPIQNWFEDGT